MTRRLHIGFTGHRPNRLHIGTERTAARLRDVLAALADANAKGREAADMIAVSPLAEGSDRLFAEAALDLGYALHGLLPFTSADYERTFSKSGRDRRLSHTVGAVSFGD